MTHMDDKNIRVAMLRRLIDERFSGVVRRLAEALDMKPPQLHRWLNKGQGISAESARNIETKIGLPRGWLDRLTDAEYEHGEASDLSLSPDMKLPVEDSQYRAAYIVTKWPFPHVDEAAYQALPDSGKLMVEGALALAIEQATKQFGTRTGKRSA